MRQGGPMTTESRRLRDHFRYVPSLLRLGMPLAMQQLLATVLNMIDTVMIGRLGEAQIGAVALGNQVFFLLMLFLFGVGSGSAVFTAQYWGNGDVAGVKRMLGLGLLIAVVGASAFNIVALTAPRTVLSLYSLDPVVLSFGARYLRIVSLSYVMTAITLTFTNVLRSVGNTKLPLAASLVSIVLNTLLNYLLIFGVGPFPVLGVAGAAIATTLARLVEMVIIILMVYRSRGPLAATPKQLLAFDRTLFRQYLRHAAPVVVNEIVWSFGFTMYTVVFARMGTAVLASYNIADTVGRLFFAFFLGSANAAAVLIGNAIGAGKSEEAAEIGQSLLVFAALVASLFGTLLLAVAPFVPRLFGVSAVVQSNVTAILRVAGFALIGRVLSLHIIVGVLRGGGDTRFALILSVGGLWGLGVVAAFLTGMVFRLPVHIVYLAMHLENLGQIVLGVPRVLSRAWIHDLTKSTDGVLQ